MPLPGYQYSRLCGTQNIRLLHLNPVADDGEDGPVYADLVETSFEDKPQYVALSYVWGQDQPNSDLHINGHVLKIRPNLSSALCTLRRRGNLKVWADAVCINQDDNEERGLQVRLMRDIYASATEVVAHLSHIGPIESEKLSSLFDIFNKVVIKTGIMRGESPPAGSIPFFVLQVLGLPAPQDPRWISFLRFLANPWFYRIWVFQESLVARRCIIVYGDGEIDQQILFGIFKWINACQLFDRLIDPIPRPPEIPKWAGMPTRNARQRFNLIGQLQGVTSDMQAKGENGSPFRSNLITLLNQVRKSEGSDPRDCVFALLGISAEASEPSLQPNYFESTEQVYLRLATFMVQKGFGPQLLRSQTYQRMKLPSWVPQWSEGDRASLPRALSATAITDLYAASFNSQPRFSIGQTEDQLVVQGTLLDIISRMGDAGIRLNVFNGIGGGKLCRLLLAFLADTLRLLEDDDRYITGEWNPEVLCRVSMCDTWNSKAGVPGNVLEMLRQWVEMIYVRWTPILDTPEVIKDPTRWSLEHGMVGLLAEPPTPESYNDLRLIAETIGNPPELAPIGELSLMFHRFISEVMGYIENGKRCRTGTGYICYIPPRAEVGDIIALIGGCGVPYVLRECGGGRYTMIGNCYVHGIMSGEAWGAAPIEDIVII